MPWSGGVYTRSNGVFTGATVWASDASVGTDITTAHHDTHDQDLATGLNNCVTIDGLNQIAASFVPDVDATYNLGAATFRWANVYVSGNVTGGTFVNSTLNAPALTGTVTGTYTLGGTPTLTSPTIASPTLSGNVAGTYTLGGTPTITAPVLSGNVTGTYTLGGTPTITAPAISTPTFSGSYSLGGTPTLPIVAGTSRNVEFITASSTTATFTADEVVVETTLGGTAYKVIGPSLTLTITNTGANGMDTGSPPTSGDLSVYLIWNPTTSTAALLGTLGSTSSGTIYSGAHMPTGYTASALVSTIKTNGSAEFGAFIQYDRTVQISQITVLSTGSGTSPTSIGLSSAVPAIAKGVSGWALTSSGQSITVQADTGSTGAVTASGLGASVTSASSFFILMKTPQAMYYYVSGGSAGAVYVSGYTF